jgi:hypothetical protein
MQVLLDPLEKQLNLPAGFVKLGNGYTGQFKVITQENIDFSGFRVFELYAA